MTSAFPPTQTSSSSTGLSMDFPADPSGDDLAKRTFEDLVGELENVAAAMDRGDIGIEEAADLYSRASALHAAAHDRLSAVQARLATLRNNTGGQG